MNICLWILQVLFGIFFSITGFGKIFWFNPALWNQALREVPWLPAVPQGLIVFTGLAEFLGGIGLILPAMTRIKPKLTPLAGAGLTLVMIFAAAFHIVRGEYGFLGLNLVLGAVCAFIAYGRLWARPIAPGSTGTFGLVKGIAVLSALVFAGLAPVWYRLTHIQ